MNRKLVCAATVLGVALTGCGSSATSKSSSSTPSTATFKAGFSADKTEFRKLGTELGQDISHAATKTDAELATQFSALATRIQQQASTLSKLNPPARYQSQLNSLITGFKSVATDLTKISTTVSVHDAKAAEAATKALLVDSAAVKSADVALSKALGLPTT